MTEDQKDVLPEPKAPDQPAVDQSPENAPAELAPETEIQVVGQREGMFGVRGTGDTSGFGGLVQPVVFPGASKRPFEGWHEDVAAALDTAIAGSDVAPAAIEGVVVHRGEITFHVRVRTCPPSRGCSATTPTSASSSAPESTG